MKKHSSQEIKDTQHLFKIMNISDNILSKKQKNSINNEGYLLIPPTEFILKNLKLLNEVTDSLIKNEGLKGGWEGKEQNNNYGKGLPFEPGANRLGNLIEKHPIFKNLILIPEILAIAYEVIKSDIKVGGLNFRNPLQGHGRQAYHIDWLPREKNSQPFFGIVCGILLDDSTEDNGATRIIPGSHKKLGWPDQYIDTGKIHEDEIKAEVKAGSIVVFNLNTWHAGATNINGKPRKTIYIQIKRREELQLLNYKKYLKEKTKKELNEPLRYLLGVRECDATQKELTAGPGNYYRKQFGKDRGALS